MFEHRSQPLLPLRAFISWQLKSVALGTGLIAFSLAVGMIGYHEWVCLSWHDAFLNASMLLSGMGSVVTFDSTHCPGVDVTVKIFAGVYELYSGLAILLIAGIVFAPVVHRVLHRFHLEAEGADASIDAS